MFCLFVLVMRKGDEADCVYLLIAGEVGIYIDEAL